MNSIRTIQALNKRELESGVPPSASWHRDFADTAFIYVGGLPFDLSEGDIVTIFSQYGEPVYVNLVRDKETGKSKGFAFLKYEDQRSTDLAVDNLGGSDLMGRLLRVDHTRYKIKEGEVISDNTREIEGVQTGEDENESGARGRDGRSESEERRPMLKEENELALLLRNQDDDDPMKEYLIQQKREEVAEALREYQAGLAKHKKKTDHRHRESRHKPQRHMDDEVRRGGKDKSSRRESRGRTSPRRRARSTTPSVSAAYDSTDERRRRRKFDEKPRERKQRDRSASKSPHREHRRAR